MWKSPPASWAALWGAGSLARLPSGSGSRLDPGTGSGTVTGAGRSRPPPRGTPAESYMCGVTDELLRLYRKLYLQKINIFCCLNSGVWTP